MGEYLSPTHVDNLYVMTHGLVKAETPALLSFSPRTEELVKILQKQFDYVLLDTAPVMPFPDARLWASTPME